MLNTSSSRILYSSKDTFRSLGTISVNFLSLDFAFLSPSACALFSNISWTSLAPMRPALTRMSVSAQESLEMSCWGRGYKSSLSVDITSSPVTPSNFTIFEPLAFLMPLPLRYSSGLSDLASYPDWALRSFTFPTSPGFPVSYSNSSSSPKSSISGSSSGSLVRLASLSCFSIILMALWFFFTGMWSFSGEGDRSAPGMREMVKFLLSDIFLDFIFFASKSILSSSLLAPLVM
mmetsp:Transcript_15676/g.28136  ORF Transcript_15676/g.28136 Transcript_15676/m.28136 type:complete len:233 (+) Transcript_15676:316-1014(+)